MTSFNSIKKSLVLIAALLSMGWTYDVHAVLDKDAVGEKRKRDKSAADANFQDSKEGKTEKSPGATDEDEPVEDHSQLLQLEITQQEPTSDMDEAAAQTALGLKYWQAEGIERDRKKALQLLRLAAEKGNARAQNALWLTYREGEGIQDLNEALQWLLRAVNQQYPPAQHNLAVAYWRGGEIQQDREKALQLFQLAADQEYPESQLALGLAYWSGEGVSQDRQKALKFFLLAAQQGNAEAQYNLGFSYWKGEGVPQDLSEAVRLFQLAANKGHAGAQCYLGAAYWSGKEVPEDLSEAVRLLQLAANQGHTAAQYYLGTAHLHGKGVPQDLSEAVRLLHLAATKGYAAAQYSLGAMHWSGEGVSQDLGKAIEWSMLCAKQNFQTTVASLTRILAYNSEAPLEDPMFEDRVREIQLNLCSLTATHEKQVVLNDQDKTFRESAVAIPQLHQLYSKIVNIEDEMCKAVQSLRSAKPGFMLTCLKPQDPLLRKIRQMPSSSFLYEDEYVTLGEENVLIACNFTGYLRGLKKKIKKANKYLKQIQVIAANPIGRLMALQRPAYESEEGKKAFDEELERSQRAADANKEIINLLYEQRATLNAVEEDLQNLIPSTAGRRNREFLHEHPFFAPPQ